MTDRLPMNDSLRKSYCTVLTEPSFLNEAFLKRAARDNQTDFCAFYVFPKMYVKETRPVEYVFVSRSVRLILSLIFLNKGLPLPSNIG